MYVVPVLGWRRGELGLLEQTAPQVAQNIGVRLEEEEEEEDGRYRKVGEGKQPFHLTGHTQARLPSSWRAARNRAMEHTKAQGEPGSCEISTQAAPNRLTSLCLGTEAQHLISRLCHLSEDKAVSLYLLPGPSLPLQFYRGAPSQYSHRALWLL